jgi:hypothetical protein
MNEENFERYLIYSILSERAKEAFQMMLKFKDWETAEELDQYMYYRGAFDALSEALRHFLER